MSTVTSKLSIAAIWDKGISRGRYNIGLVIFCVPLLFGWLSLYISKWVPGLYSHPLPYAIGGDILILASLLILGGDF
jgi:hypothetical protein